MFAVALVNSDFKTAESDYRNMEDTLISAGLDILSEVGFWESLRGKSLLESWVTTFLPD